MIETKLGLGGYVTNIRFIDKDGNSFRPKEFSNDDPIYNRIVDAGLDMPASHYWANCFTVGSVGTGTSGTSDSMTTLEAYSSHSNTYPNSSALNGYEIDLDSITKSIKLFRTFTISANSSGSSVFISEIGVGNEDASNPAIFARILLPTSIEWEDGLEFQFTYNLRINYPSIANNPQAKTIQAWDGLDIVDIEGYERIELNESEGAIGVQIINSDGEIEDFLSTDIRRTLEPASSLSAYYRSGGFLSLSTSGFYDYGDSSFTKETYIDGSNQIVRVSGFNSDIAPGIALWSVGISGRSNVNLGSGYIFVADSTFTKQVGRKFTITQTISWDRA